MIPTDTLVQIRNLVADDRLVLFVGAGISYSATHSTDPQKRIPLWSELGTRLASDMSMDIAEWKDVLELFDASGHQHGRDQLEGTIAHHLDDSEFVPSDIHRAIMDCGISTIYTTNYDSLLSRAGNVSLIASEKDYDKQQTSEDRFLYQIHGTLNDMHTLTREDYRSWRDRRPRAVLKLTQHLAEKSFLFIGYSLNDPHLTDGIIPEVKAILKDRQHPHFAWMWNLADNPRKLLSKRDGIEAFRIDNDQEWIDALRAISVKRTFRPRPAPSGPVALSVTERTEDKAPINPYKLYHFRTLRKHSIAETAKACDISIGTYRSLERITNLRAPPSTKNFKSVSVGKILALESFLRCNGELGLNGRDDLQGSYVEYYLRNRSKKSDLDESEQDFLSFETKVVVFDFDGTLTRPISNETTWEALWTALGYDTKDCINYHAMYSNNRITHRQWCEITRDKFRARSLKREMVAELARKIVLIDGIAVSAVPITLWWRSSTAAAR
jgi:hypothetical protein